MNSKKLTEKYYRNYRMFDFLRSIRSGKLLVRFNALFRPANGGSGCGAGRGRSSLAATARYVGLPPARTGRLFHAVTRAIGMAVIRRLFRASAHRMHNTSPILTRK